MKKRNSGKNQISKKNNDKNKQNKDIYLNFNETEVDGFQVFSPIEPLEQTNNKFAEVINPFEIKNSNDYIKSWKTLEDLEEVKEEKELFDDLWDNILNLINNNILDYSLINEIMHFLGDEDLMKRFLFLLFSSLDDSLDLYIRDKNYFLILKNNVIFFMIILLNLKNNEKFNDFFAKEKIEYLTMFITKLQKIKDKTVKKYFNDILYKLFSVEYIHLGLNLLLSNKIIDEKNEEKENIINDKGNEINELSNNNINNNKINSEAQKILDNFYQIEKDTQIMQEKFKKEKYSIIIESLFNFESSDFLNYEQDNNFDFPFRFHNHMELVQNILFIVFSKEKYLYLKNEDCYYEYEFLDRTIKKNIFETKEIHEDKYKNLFRRDTISNNIIKYLFFIFGNYMIIESIIKPLNVILNITGLNNEFEIISFKGNSIKAERNITKDEFDILFEKIITKLNENIPFILRIFLKMIYDNIINEYPNLEKNDYSPLSSLFFFSYLSNPRIQSIYKIYPDKYLLIKSVYKLLYNASFNIKFKESDDLNIFNDEIEKYSKKINEFYENNVINVDTSNEENKKYLKNLFDELGVIYPEFLFYLCCDYFHDLNKTISRSSIYKIK